MFTCTLFAVASIFFLAYKKRSCVLQLLEYSYAHCNQHISNTLWYFYFIYLFICITLHSNSPENYFTHVYYKLFQTSFLSFSAS